MSIFKEINDAINKNVNTLENGGTITYDDFKMVLSIKERDLCELPVGLVKQAIKLDIGRNFNVYVKDCNEDLLADLVFNCTGDPSGKFADLDCLNYFTVKAGSFMKFIVESNNEDGSFTVKIKYLENDIATYKYNF